LTPGGVELSPLLVPALAPPHVAAALASSAAPDGRSETGPWPAGGGERVRPLGPRLSTALDARGALREAATARGAELAGLASASAPAGSFARLAQLGPAQLEQLRRLGSGPPRRSSPAAPGLQAASLAAPATSASAPANARPDAIRARFAD